MNDKSDVPKTFDGEYYDKDYFQTPEGNKENQRMFSLKEMRLED